MNPFMDPPMLEPTKIPTKKQPKKRCDDKKDAFIQRRVSDQKYKIIQHHVFLIAAEKCGKK